MKREAAFITIVDDDAALREALAFVFCTDGNQVGCFASGENCCRN